MVTCCCFFNQNVLSFNCLCSALNFSSSVKIYSKNIIHACIIMNLTRVWWRSIVQFINTSPLQLIKPGWARTVPCESTKQYHLVEIWADSQAERGEINLQRLNQMYRLNNTVFAAPPDSSAHSWLIINGCFKTFQGSLYHEAPWLHEGNQDSQRAVGLISTFKERESSVTTHQWILSFQHVVVSLGLVKDFGLGPPWSQCCFDEVFCSHPY